MENRAIKKKIYYERSKFMKSLSKKQRLDPEKNDSDLDYSEGENPGSFQRHEADQNFAFSSSGSDEEPEFEKAEDINDRQQEDLSDKSDISLANNLKEWALRNKISRQALGELLGILQDPKLPKDPRTLLETPKNVLIDAMGSGHFWYHGIVCCLQKQLKATSLDESNSVRLNFNVDGLPLFRSSKLQFWPILMNIAGFNVKPSVVAIFCGNKKPPSAEEFLKKFSEELNFLLQNGLTLESGKQIELHVNAFICDTPARAFIKCIKGHNAYNSCTKCSVVGEYDSKGRHMSFADTNCGLRTHDEFVNKVDIGHHLRDSASLFCKSPLEGITGIDMIKNFPIADSMHLLELGIMKRCLTSWIRGSFNIPKIFTPQNIAKISRWLEMANEFFPSEATRRIRNLDVVAFWKSIEFRTFLLYLGPVVLENILPNAFYEHLLCISAAATIFASEYYCKNIEIREFGAQMMNKYVDQHIILYGRDSISSNVHNLVHVKSDIDEFGAMPNISAYPFESTLYQIKCLLKGGHKPLEQVAKRIIERDDLDECLRGLEADCTLSRCTAECYYLKVQLKSFSLSSDKKNKWFLTKNDEVVEFNYAEKQNESEAIFGKKITDLTDFFKNPYSSRFLNIYKSSLKLENLKSYSKTDLKAKLVCLQTHNDEFVFLPLVHTLQ